MVLGQSSDRWGCPDVLHHEVGQILGGRAAIDQSRDPRMHEVRQHLALHAESLGASVPQSAGWMRARSRPASGTRRPSAPPGRRRPCLRRPTGGAIWEGPTRGAGGHTAEELGEDLPGRSDAEGVVEEATRPAPEHYAARSDSDLGPKSWIPVAGAIEERGTRIRWQLESLAEDFWSGSRQLRPARPLHRPGPLHRGPLRGPSEGSRGIDHRPMSR